MNKITLITFVTTIFFVPPAIANLISSSDAWQHTNISSISANTIHGDSNAKNMFGFTSGNTEATNTVFNDASALGYWHTVEWTLNAAIQLGSFNLVASHDGTNYNPSDWYTNGYRDQNYRGFGAFKLEYKDASNTWQQLFLLNNIGTTAVLGDGATHPVYGGGANYTALWAHELYANVTPTSATTWRASFQQFGPPNGHASGPRILELDGYVYQNNIPGPIPEPATMLLFGTGILGLAGVARRKRS